MLDTKKQSHRLLILLVLLTAPVIIWFLAKPTTVEAHTNPPCFHTYPVIGFSDCVFSPGFYPNGYTLDINAYVMNYNDGLANVSVTWGDGNSTTLYANMGIGTVYAGATHIYPNNCGQSYTVTLLITSGIGPDTDSKTFNAPPCVPGGVRCSPSPQTATTQQTVSFTAGGGDGNYSWVASDHGQTGTGADFSTAWSNAGPQSVTVTSNGTTDSCNVTVNAQAAGGGPGLIDLYPNFLRLEVGQDFQFTLWRDDGGGWYDGTQTASTWATRYPPPPNLPIVNGAPIAAPMCANGAVYPSAGCPDAVSGAGQWSRLRFIGVSPGTVWVGACAGSCTNPGDDIIQVVAPPLPTADIKANGSDGPINIPNNTAATISWTSVKAYNGCSVAPTGWTGTSNTGVSTGNLTSSVTYTLTCTNYSGSTQDSVTVNVPGNRTLTVTKSGTGTGTVTSSPAGINCGATCSANYTSGTVVMLTATPSGGSAFGGWSGGGCSGTGSCFVTLSANTTVDAAFGNPPTAPVITGVVNTACPTQQTVSWNDVAGETQYNVWWNTSNTAFNYGVADGWTSSANIAANTTSYIHTGLSASTNYWHIVTATNASGSSASAPVGPTLSLSCSANLTTTVKMIDEYTPPGGVVQNYDNVNGTSVLKTGTGVRFFLGVSNTGLSDATINYICDTPSVNFSWGGVSGSYALYNGGTLIGNYVIDSNAACYNAVTNPNGRRLTGPRTVPAGQTRNFLYATTYNAQAGAGALELCSNTAVINYTDLEAAGKTLTVRFGPRLCNKGASSFPGFKEVAP